MHITGTIRSFQGSWSSGLAILSIKEDNGKLRYLHADNGPLARALDSMFGCIRPGHCIDNSRLRGHRVTVSLDELGLIEGIGSEEMEE